MIEPTDAVGVILGITETGEIEHCGSCFLFNTSLRIVTAAHCVPTGYLYFQVVLPKHSMVTEVEDYQLHPTADLAVLTMADHWRPANPEGRDSLPRTSFVVGTTTLSLGSTFQAIGFPPIDTQPSQEPNTVSLPPLRLFGGFVQRRFRYTDLEGRTYEAVELNVAAPRGLSGSPIWEVTAQFRDPWQSLIGLVAANAESTTIVDSYEVTEAPEKTTRVRVERLQAFGIGLVFTPEIFAWLTEHAPPPSPAFP